MQRVHISVITVLHQIHDHILLLYIALQSLWLFTHARAGRHGRDMPVNFTQGARFILYPLFCHMYVSSGL
jgi:hypothetical protein